MVNTRSKKLYPSPEIEAAKTLVNFTDDLSKAITDGIVLIPKARSMRKQVSDREKAFKASKTLVNLKKDMTTILEDSDMETSDSWMMIIHPSSDRRPKGWCGYKKCVMCNTDLEEFVIDQSV